MALESLRRLRPLSCVSRQRVCVCTNGFSLTPQVESCTEAAKCVDVACIVLEEAGGPGAAAQAAGHVQQAAGGDAAEAAGHSVRGRRRPPPRRCLCLHRRLPRRPASPGPPPLCLRALARRHFFYSYTSFEKLSGPQTGQDCLLRGTEWSFNRVSHQQSDFKRQEQSRRGDVATPGEVAWQKGDQETCGGRPVVRCHAESAAGQVAGRRSAGGGRRAACLHRHQHRLPPGAPRRLLPGHWASPACCLGAPADQPMALSRRALSLRLGLQSLVCLFPVLNEWRTTVRGCSH